VRIVAVLWRSILPATRAEHWVVLRDADFAQSATTVLGNTAETSGEPGSGSLSSRRRFADLDDGSPDGMLVDDEAHLWSAVRGGSRIERRSPMGDLVLRIDLPARQPTSLTMSDGHLFVTSALDGLADAGPADGHLLRLATSLTCTPAVSAALDH